VTGFSEIGSICWMDLTVSNAEQVVDFYRQVVGWQSAACDMGGYRDFCMLTPDTRRTVSGICRARGANADLPPQWLLYIVVADVDKSVRRCVELGGEILAGPRELGEQGRFCVIRDPAGAVAALIAPK
jgi:uncharacterized protein